MINIEITRTEAEYIVDLLESQKVLQATLIADTIREICGMKEREDS